MEERNAAPSPPEVRVQPLRHHSAVQCSGHRFSTRLGTFSEKDFNRVVVERVGSRLLAGGYLQVGCGHW